MGAGQELRILRLGPLRGLGLLDRIRALIDVRGQIALQHLFRLGFVDTEPPSDGLGTVLFRNVAILWSDLVGVGQFLLLSNSGDRQNKYEKSNSCSYQSNLLRVFGQWFEPPPAPALLSTAP